MKYSEEQLLIVARPEDCAGNAAFVARTMQAIKAARVMHTTRTGVKDRFFNRLKALPTAALIGLIIAGIITLGGAAYAAVRFAPTVIKIFSKETSQRGTTEYSVPDFAACVGGGEANPTSKFELNKDAPRFGDDEIEKILQARCEMPLAEQFVSNTWHTYGTHEKWQDGDDIFYTRLDMLGTLKSVSSTAATIDTGESHLVDYIVPKGEKIIAYANGQEIPLGKVRPGDTVFTIIRVAETYDTRLQPGSRGGPRPQGIVALLVLSLPAEYYGGMQQYLTTITPCMGNPGESCPGTPYIDVFPREGGEGATNRAFIERPDNISREISGTVSELSANSLTLKTRTGKEYIVTTPADDIAAYNSAYATNYTDVDATLRVGSTVSVLYAQTPGSDPQTITPDQIRMINLLLDSSNPKAGNVKQY